MVASHSRVIIIGMQGLALALLATFAMQSWGQTRSPREGFIYTCPYGKENPRPWDRPIVECIAKEQEPLEAWKRTRPPRDGPCLRADQGSSAKPADEGRVTSRDSWPDASKGLSCKSLKA